LEIPQNGGSGRDHAVTTIVEALRAIGAGEPEALRKATDALTLALGSLMAASPDAKEGAR
jgi:hypothetical protein